jgi:hypothetical protein
MAKNAIDNLKAQMQKDYDKFVTDFTSNLRVRTPIRTGAARRAWNKVGDLKIGSGLTKRILTNAVGYASILDDGWSRQEPKGIVDNAFKQTKK